jgi:hypothetical protein
MGDCSHIRNRGETKATIMVGNAPVIAVQFATGPIANGTEVPSLKRCIWANASVTNSIFGHFAKAVPLIFFYSLVVHILLFLVQFMTQTGLQAK